MRCALIFKIVILSISSPKEIGTSDTPRAADSEACGERAAVRAASLSLGPIRFVKSQASTHPRNPAQRGKVAAACRRRRAGLRHVVHFISAALHNDKAALPRRARSPQ